MPDEIILLKATEIYPRLDLFIRDMLDEPSRSEIGKWIKNQQVSLNGAIMVRKNHRILPGDRIEIITHQAEDKVRLPSTLLPKLFEDHHIIIINKPSGISVHPGAGSRDETILDMLLAQYPHLVHIADSDRPGIVHRLDKGTSGILILAKDIQSQSRLQKAFKRRQVKKTYQALVKGNMRLRLGTLDKPLMRNPRSRTKFMVDQLGVNPEAREAITRYQVVLSSDRYSWLKIFPETGRTHQIRVHLASTGHPVLGDHLYGDGQSFERLALHAYGIEFNHPATGQMITASTPIPSQFKQFIIKFFLNPNRTQP